MPRVDPTIEWTFVRDAVAGALSEMAAADRMTDGSARKYELIFMMFTRFAEAHRCRTPDAVSPRLCTRFLVAPSRTGRSPSIATSRLRRSVIRHGYAILLDAGLAHANPTVGVQVPSGRRQGWRPFPLTPLEVDRLRNSGRTRVDDTLRPAVVELCLAGASHREVSLTAVADIDFQSGDLRLAAGTPQERVLPVCPVGLATLRRQVNSQQQVWRRRLQTWDPSAVPLAMYRPVASYPNTSVAPTVSMNVSRALSRAGVSRLGVRPRSLREYAANQAYATTGRIEDAARMLGLTSLDTTFRIIDAEWQEAWGTGIRGVVQECRTTDD